MSPPNPHTPSNSGPLFLGSAIDPCSSKTTLNRVVETIAIDGDSVLASNTNQVAPASDLAQRDELITRKLTERYDALNQHIIAAEGLLKGLKPPHSVWVGYNSDDEGECELLGLAKVADQWRLVHARENELRPDRGVFDLKPLSDCPVHVRVDACKRLHTLHKRIIEAKEKYLPAIDEAIQQVMQFCETHATVKPKPGKK